MDQNKPSELDSLTAEIDNAVEDLFGAYSAPAAPVGGSTKEVPASRVAPPLGPPSAIQPEPIVASPTTPAAPLPTQNKAASSGLDAEIDKAVDDLFGAYASPQTSVGLNSSESAPPPSPAPPLEQQQPTVATSAPPVTHGESQSLGAEIDKAVEDLFGAYESPKPGTASTSQPLTPQVSTQPRQTPTPEIPDLELAEEIPDSIPAPAHEIPSPEAVPAGDIWELLDQAFLTIEWEVTASNIRAAKRILDGLRSEYRLDEKPEQVTVLHLMEQILSAMAQAPQTVPTAAPQALKDSLSALKSGHQKFDAAAEKLLSKAITELQSALPGKTSETVGIGAGAGVSPILLKHIRFLAYGIKNIASFENLFSKKPAFKKLYDLEVKIHNIFQSQSDKFENIVQQLNSNGLLKLAESDESAIKAHINLLEQCKKNLISLENLFSQKTAHQKIYTAHKKLRTSLEKQLQAMCDLVPSDNEIPSISSYLSIEEVAPVSPEETIAISPIDEVEVAGPQRVAEAVQDAPDELTKIVRSHVTALERCKNNLLPLEKIFVKAGHEKIHSTLHGIKEEIEGQMIWLSRALTGDYKSQPAAVLKSATGSVQGQVKPSCPWKNLVTAEWLGTTVAFIPTEVAYEERAKSWVKNRYGKLFELPIIKLKPHFWRKLGPLFRGEMKFLGETYLKHMVVPMLNHVGPVRTKVKPPKKPVLLVLFNEGYSGSVIIDKPTKSFPISKNWAWEPINQQGSILAGYLTVKGKSLPVITISRLE